MIPIGTAKKKEIPTANRNAHHVKLVGYARTVMNPRASTWF